MNLEKNNIKENYISLFYNNISTVFDLFLRDNLIIFDYLVDEKIVSKIKFISTNFLSFIKRNKLKRKKKQSIYLDLLSGPLLL